MKAKVIRHRIIEQNEERLEGKIVPGDLAKAMTVIVENSNEWKEHAKHCENPELITVNVPEERVAEESLIEELAKQEEAMYKPGSIQKMGQANYGSNPATAQHTVAHSYASAPGNVEASCQCGVKVVWRDEASDEQKKAYSIADKEGFSYGGQVGSSYMKKQSSNFRYK
jgi:hypothetical protein